MVDQGLIFKGDCHGKFPLILENKDSFNRGSFVVVDINMVAIFSWGERLYYIAYRYEIPKEEKKGIWLKLSVEKSDFILVVVMEAFEYHQTEKGYMTPTYCLSERLIILSANASHQVSVEGFVIHEINMVLVVQEKYCVLSFTELWKIPSCSIVESDEIFTGVVKEVKEEIEIDNKFMEVVSFRQVHDVASEKSDLPIIFLSEISTSAYIVVGLTDAPRRAVIRHTFLTTYANQVVAPMVHKVQSLPKFLSCRWSLIYFVRLNGSTNVNSLVNLVVLKREVGNV